MWDWALMDSRLRVDPRTRVIGTEGFEWIRYRVFLPLSSVREFAEERTRP